MSSEKMERFLKTMEENRNDSVDIPPNDDPRKNCSYARMLTLAEVDLLWDESMLKRRDRNNTDIPMMLKRTKDYVTQFKRGNQKNIIEEMRKMCEETGLSEFETVTLINLLPTNAENARELIPSLKKKRGITDDMLEILICDLKSVSGYSNN